MPTRARRTMQRPWPRHSKAGWCRSIITGSHCRKCRSAASRTAATAPRAASRRSRATSSPSSSRTRPRSIGRSMNIASHRVHVVRLPADEPLANMPDNPGATRPTVVLELVTDDGLEGIGLTFLGAGLTRALAAAVDDLATLAHGSDALSAQAIVRKLTEAAGGAGPAGIFTLAMAAIDIALWDLRGKV